jgi:hypothetical protein
MKLTVMMLLASNKRGHPQRMGAALTDDSSLAVTAVNAAGEEEMKNRRYWQMLENLEEAEIEGTGTNRTHPSSIWYRQHFFRQHKQQILLYTYVCAWLLFFRLIYNRVPRCGGLTMVFLMKELAKVNRFAHQRHQYRTPWNRSYFPGTKETELYYKCFQLKQVAY